MSRTTMSSVRGKFGNQKAKAEGVAIRLIIRNFVFAHQGVTVEQVCPIAKRSRGAVNVHLVALKEAGVIDYTSNPHSKALHGMWAAPGVAPVFPPKKESARPLDGEDAAPPLKIGVLPPAFFGGVRT